MSNTDDVRAESGGDAPQYNHLELVQPIDMGEDSAMELAGELLSPLGLIKDHTYDGHYWIVRWHDDE